jgi:protoporphyrinogen/coproporphyrinogen III oxidase
VPGNPVIIIGGGISGLATAYFLGKRGIRSTIIEKSNRLGGLIKTDSIEGCQLEAGPDSFIATKPAVAKLAEEIPGLSQQIIGSNDAARRVFIVRKGELVPMPRGMSMMVPGDWRATMGSSLFSLRTKARFFTEILTLPKTRTGDVSIEDFVQDHFGSEVLRYVADPLLAGVYGGQTANLSTRSVLPRFLEQEEKYGSLIRATRKDRARALHKGSLFLSFQAGMQTLINALVSRLDSVAEVVHEEAKSVQRNGDQWRVRAGDSHLDAENVILACPAYAAAALLENLAPPLASELAAIPYSSAILVTFVYERSRLNHPLDGFGFLVPQIERQHVAAATWVSTKFPSRTPSHLAAIRAFLVDQEAVRLMDATDSELVEIVSNELGRLMGVKASPLTHTIYRWPQSMPQYTVGHEERRSRIEAGAQQYPGLFLIGNAYEGVGIPDCIRRAHAAAENLVLSNL